MDDTKCTVKKSVASLRMTRTDSLSTISNWLLFLSMLCPNIDSHSQWQSPANVLCIEQCLFTTVDCSFI